MTIVKDNVKNLEFVKNLNKKNTYLWTSESVSKGHPDKVADQISDAVLDAVLAQDKDANVACETFVTGNFVLVGGEITSTAKVDVEAIVRKTIISIGYDRDELEFNGHTCEILNKIQRQSPEINKAVIKEDGNIGAGDQGIMFGYASNETPDYMPLTIWLANALIKKLEHAREAKHVDFLRPDAKSQVTIEYDSNGNALRIDTILISTQHSPTVSSTELGEYIVGELIPNLCDTLPKNIASLFDSNTKYLINPSGSFIIGGPVGDSGLTGRKIVIDNYGADCQIGGGAFSGKNYTKVDRSGAYIARYVAKNIVANGYADKCKIQLSYSIGIAEPTSIRIERFGEDKVGITDFDLVELVKSKMDFTPKSILKKLKLENPIYQVTAFGGHFGRTPYVWRGIEFFTWEKLDLF